MNETNDTSYLTNEKLYSSLSPSSAVKTLCERMDERISKIESIIERLIEYSEKFI